jgi:hypothetical protein
MGLSVTAGAYLTSAHPPFSLISNRKLELDLCAVSFVWALREIVSRVNLGSALSIHRLLFTPLTSPAVFRVPFQSHILSSDTSMLTFNVISHEYHARIVNPLRSVYTRYYISHIRIQILPTSPLTE